MDTTQSISSTIEVENCPVCGGLVNSIGTESDAEEVINSDYSICTKYQGPSRLIVGPCGHRVEQIVYDGGPRDRRIYLRSESDVPSDLEDLT